MIVNISNIKLKIGRPIGIVSITDSVSGSSVGGFGWISKWIVTRLKVLKHNKGDVLGKVQRNCEID